MKLTPEIEKIALQEAEEVGLLQRKLQGTTGRQVLNFVENFLDALPNIEQDYKAQLAEIQAREKKLRKALESYKWKIEGGLICVPNGSINEALDTPSDATALNELIAKAGEVMRERCAKLIDYDYSLKGGKAIRALPGVTLEDLKS